MPDGEKQSLLLIHGRDFKPAADTYLDISVEAMRTGLQRDYPECVEYFDAMDKDLAKQIFSQQRIPTPRWVLYDKVRFGAEIPKEAKLVHQERAYTSPIWYTP